MDVMVYTYSQMLHFPPTWLTAAPRFFNFLKSVLQESAGPINWGKAAYYNLSQTLQKQELCALDTTFSFYFNSVLQYNSFIIGKLCKFLTSLKSMTLPSTLHLQEEEMPIELQLIGISIPT